MVGMAEMETPISLDGVAVHPDCRCVCLYYLHFAPENPEDGEMYLLVVPADSRVGCKPDKCEVLVWRDGDVRACVVGNNAEKV